jgi:hypothetical protein
MLLLIATRDMTGTFRFPSIQSVSQPSGPYWGVSHQVARLDHEKASINRKLSQIFGQDLKHFWRLHDLVDEEITLPDQGEQSRLRLVEVLKPLAQPSWISMPDVLRSMPRSRVRVPYLKVFQILMGQHLETTEALSVDELRKHLLKQEEAAPSAELDPKGGGR